MRSRQASKATVSLTNTAHKFSADFFDDFDKDDEPAPAPAPVFVDTTPENAVRDKFARLALDEAERGSGNVAVSRQPQILKGAVNKAPTPGATPTRQTQAGAAAHKHSLWDDDDDFAAKKKPLTPYTSCPSHSPPLSISFSLSFSPSSHTSARSYHLLITVLQIRAARPLRVAVTGARVTTGALRVRLLCFPLSATFLLLSRRIDGLGIQWLQRWRLQ